jgi:hypothetical protein
MAGASWSLARPRRCSPSRPRYVADQIARAGRGGRAEPPAIRRKRSIRRQRQFRRMDDAKFGAACRAVRVPKHLIQAAVAEAAGVRRSIGGRPPGGWRAGGHVTRDGAQGASCSRDVDGHHTALARVGPGPDHQPRPAVIQESVLRRLAAVPGWIGVPEVSFSICGERGAIDILGWHQATQDPLDRRTQDPAGGSRRTGTDDGPARSPGQTLRTRPGMAALSFWREPAAIITRRVSGSRRHGDGRRTGHERDDPVGTWTHERPSDHSPVRPGRDRRLLVPTTVAVCRSERA